MSIRLRLTLWYSAILAVTLFFFGFSLYFLLSTMTMNQYKQNLTEHAEKVQQRIAYGVSLSLRGLTSTSNWTRWTIFCRKKYTCK